MVQRHDDEYVRALYARYQTGESMRDIAASLGQTTPPLARLFKRHGYRVRSVRETRTHTDSHVLALHRRYQSGESLREIAATIPCSHIWLHELFVSRGLSLRTISEARRLQAERRHRTHVE